MSLGEPEKKHAVVIKHLTLQKGGQCLHNAGTHLYCGNLTGNLLLINTQAKCTLLAKWKAQ